MPKKNNFERDPTLPTWGPSSSNELKVDCVMSQWSAWTPCSKTCGPNAVQQRTRNVVYAPKGLSKLCKGRIEERKCELLACPV